MSTSEVKKLTAAIAGILLAAATLRGQQPPASSAEQGDSFRFKSGVELINVTATVTDASGRFVPDLRKEDFLVYEDDQTQAVTHFSAERVPVSLGIVLDTSGSMAGDKMRAAQTRAQSLPLRSTRPRRRVVSVRVQQRSETSSELDDRPRAVVTRARAHRAERRHGDV